MSTTLLTGVNDLLKRVGEISGDAGALSSLTDSARQKHIDRAVQFYNEAIIQLYDMTNLPLPNELAEGSITLVAGTRSYSAPANAVKINWPLHDQTNGNYIGEYPGGYLQMMKDQAQPANFTGRPQAGALSPVNGNIYLDRVPTSAEAGEVYVVYYDKSLLMTLAADTFPFSDSVYTSLRAAVAQIWERYSHKDFDSSMFTSALATTASLLNPNQRSGTWTRYRGKNANLAQTDPYNG